jgi:malate dehydrogenase (oxaloacetate-decarboxylating)(NADP+)
MTSRGLEPSSWQGRSLLVHVTSYNVNDRRRYMGAVNLSNVPIEDQKLVFMGAGSAGVGVAKQLLEYYTRRGLTEQEAKDKFYLVDTKGLVTKDRGDRLAEHKKYFARHDNNGHQFKTLEEVIEYVKPTALVGLAATFGVFTESVVRALKVSVDAGGLGRRPILFPLSNPTTKAECTFEQVSFDICIPCLHC